MFLWEPLRLESHLFSVCNSHRMQRGAISVEFVLVLPLLLILIVGASFFGRIWLTHHKLANAANYAVRAAAIAHKDDPAHIRSLIEDRLGERSGCSSVHTTATTTPDTLGVTRLEVTVRCTLAEAFGSQMFRAVAPDNIEVTVAMPVEAETNR